VCADEKAGRGARRPEKIRHRNWRFGVLSHRLGRGGEPQPSQSVAAGDDRTLGIPPSILKDPPGTAGRSDYDCGQRRRLSCPTRCSSSPMRCRRAVFSARSRARVAACSRSRARRHCATRQRGEQVCRRPATGWPQTTHDPGAGGVRTSPGATSGMGASDSPSGRDAGAGRVRSLCGGPRRHRPNAAESGETHRPVRLGVLRPASVGVAPRPGLDYRE